MNEFEIKTQLDFCNEFEKYLDKEDDFEDIRDNMKTQKTELEKKQQELDDCHKLLRQLTFKNEPEIKRNEDEEEAQTKHKGHTNS
jgi:hypothetical protein